jgi:putative transcriptional regulator
VDVRSLAPGLLVALPQLLDPNFKRTVVLLIHHDESGTFGLVLNRRSEISAESLCATLGIDWRGDAADRVDWGGPVQPNTGWVLLGAEGAGDDEASEVAAGVHFAGSLATLRRVAESPGDELRLFLGYAGWGPGQLERELAQGAWLLAPANADVIFHVEPELLWEHVLRRLGIDPVTLVATPGIH